MTPRYSAELRNLETVYAAARSCSIERLVRVVQAWLASPMLMIGSGGSYSTATFAAHLHEVHSGRLARAATPLEVAHALPLDAGVACFTASGRNRDILSAFQAAALAEAAPLSALVLGANTPMHRLAERYGYSDVCHFEHQAYKDGFLAVASLMASALLIARSYRLATGQRDADLPKTLRALVRRHTSLTSLQRLSDRADLINARPVVSVLFTRHLNAAAVDLESRYVEAALGPLHIADVRNFGHGRHVWFARRAAETGVVALIGEEQQELGDKTLRLLPDGATVLPIHFSGPSDLQALAGLAVSLYLAESAGRLANVDPGKPGVPRFGRDLYNLKPQMQRTGQKVLNARAALRRKGFAESEQSHRQLRKIFDELRSARFGGLLLDYDGTLCDPRARFEPLTRPVADVLNRLLVEGAYIGIATGRGPSAGQALRDAIRKPLWGRIVVGYYNGALARPLADTTDPLVPNLPTSDVRLRRLRSHPAFQGNTVRANAVQISIDVAETVPIAEAVASAKALLTDGGRIAYVVSSSHSIDVLLDGQRKTDLIGYMTEHFHVDAPILRIGDKGRWPGNDAELLDDVYGVSVDEVSRDWHGGWSLTPAGIRGLQGTLYYLNRLSWTRRGGRLKLTLGARA